MLFLYSNGFIGDNNYYYYMTTFCLVDVIRVKSCFHFSTHPEFWILCNYKYESYALISAGLCNQFSFILNVFVSVSVFFSFQQCFVCQTPYQKIKSCKRWISYITHSVKLKYGINLGTDLHEMMGKQWWMSNNHQYWRAEVKQWMGSLFSVTGHAHSLNSDSQLCCSILVNFEALSSIILLFVGINVGTKAGGVNCHIWAI